MKHLSRPCPICDFTEGDILHTQHFVLPSRSPLPDRYDLICCPECGFVFADTFAPQSVYTRYYRQLSKYEENTFCPDGSELLESQRFQDQAKTIASFLDDCDRILDIGCARGDLLREIRSLGFAGVVGLDPSQNCVEHVRRQGIEAHQGDLFEQTSLGEEKFDMVILSGVLEHLRELRSVPLRIAQLLGNDGCCYIEVPDASAYGDFPTVPYYYFDCEHINHFDEMCIDNLFLPAGYERISCGRRAVKTPRYEYPNMFCVYRRNTHGHVVERKRSESVFQGVCDHLCWSKERTSTNFFDDLARNGRPVVVWGAGQMTMRLLATTPLRKCNILFFVDKDGVKQGTSLQELPIYGPEAIEKHSGDILVASVHFADEIITEIRAKGFDNPITNLSDFLT